MNQMQVYFATSNYSQKKEKPHPWQFKIKNKKSTCTSSSHPLVLASDFHQVDADREKTFGRRRVNNEQQLSLR